MAGEQFSDKDKALVEDFLKSADTPYGEPIIIKKFVGFASQGDPARGIQPKLQFNQIRTKAIVDTVTQNDVMNSGGLYQIGDIKVTLKEKLNIIDTTNQIGGQSQGDQIIYEGHQYRILGKSHTHALVGKEQLFGYVFRKVGNS